MNIVYCADRRALVCLHVSIYSVLRFLKPGAGGPAFSVFSDALGEEDLAPVRRSLDRLKKPYTLALKRVDASRFAAYPNLNGSHATYFRLLLAEEMQAERFLYLDADTLCLTDLGELFSLDLGTAPVGWVAEAPLEFCADQGVASLLGFPKGARYHNAGVLLIARRSWLEARISERAFDFLGTHSARYHDQTALNYLLCREGRELPERFNCIANLRSNWPRLARPLNRVDALVHFVDYPKPWSFLGELAHPQHHLWKELLSETEASGYRSWNNRSQEGKRPAGGLTPYRKAAKDAVLFGLYRRGLLAKPKGVPAAISSVSQKHT